MLMASSASASSGFLHLSASVRPSAYRMLIVPDLDAFTFTGEQRVWIEVHEPVREIMCHSKDIKIGTVSIYDRDGKEKFIPESVVYKEDAEVVFFKFGQTIGAGNYCLDMSWSGNLNDQLKGFYRSRYTLRGKTRSMAVTQFEPTFARFAFPCWDEPTFKAKFQVSLIVPGDRVAISNMPVRKKHEGQDGTVRYDFDESPVMSTYLVAFIVGDFDFVSTLSENGVRTTVIPKTYSIASYTPPGKSAMGQHALYVASKALAFFEDSFGIKYPLPKSDLLAIPDFAAGAMENWGAVTYRETRLLVDAKTTSLASRIRCTRTVCHELAHMWFGNLTTMVWWTHLWLNEGFARFMEFGAVDFLFPKWKVWDIFVQQVHGLALSLDALVNTHPIEVSVKAPEEVEAIFDVISYAKGASVIRMLSSFMSHDIFMKGVKQYLTAHKYANAETTDLWKALSWAWGDGKNVRELMSSWTSKPGYPVITIEDKKGGDDKKRTFVVKQARFFSSGIAPGREMDDQTVWHIPLPILHGSGKVSKVLITKKEQEITLECTSGKEWLWFNHSMVGFYRCNLSSSLLDAIASNPEAIRKLEGVNLLGVISDTFAMANAGMIAYSSALNMAKACKGCETLCVIEELSDWLCSLLKRYKKPQDSSASGDEKAIQEGIEGIITSLFRPLEEKYGWEYDNKKQGSAGEKETNQTLREVVISTLAAARDAKVLEEAKRRFRKGWEDISPEYKSLCFRTMVRYEGKEGYDAVLKIFKDPAAEALDVRRALTAVGCTPEKELQLKTLEWASDGSTVRAQDVRFALASVARAGSQVAWEWLEKNLERLKKTYPGGKVYESIIGNLTPAFNTGEHAGAVLQFVTKNKIQSRAIMQAVERMKMAAVRRARELKPLASYFK